MQSYTEIPSSATLQESRGLLLNNDKTIMSCNSGTAFPTTNLQVGMLCFRTDQNKLYELKSDGKTWHMIADLTKTPAPLESPNFSGTPTVGGNKIWHAGNDGAGSGLDADLLDGQHASYFTNIPARLGYTPANKAGDTFSGAVTFNGNVTLNGATTAAGAFTATNANGGVQLNNANTKLTQGSGSTQRITTPSGYVEIGPMNTSYSHFQTDRASFHFNKPVRVAGDLYAGASYDQRVWHAGNLSFSLSGSQLTITTG